MLGYYTKLFETVPFLGSHWLTETTRRITSNSYLVLIFNVSKSLWCAITIGNNSHILQLAVLQHITFAKGSLQH